MSDFSAFNLENFDLYKWINETIETKRPNEDFDTFLSSVSMKLQLLSQDCSDHNEEQMKLIMERLPSVIKEVSLYASQLDSIKLDMKELSEKVAGAEKNDCIQHLSQLRHIQTNMSVCKKQFDSLSEWDQYVKNIETALTNNEIENAASILKTMNDSFAFLEQLPNQPERKEHIRQYKEKVCSAINSKCLTALKNNMTTDLMFYKNIYSQIDELDYFITVYATKCKEDILQLWTEASTAENKTDALATFWGSFYNYICILEENKSALFGGANDFVLVVTARLYQDAFSSLIEPINNYLKTVPIPSITSIFDNTFHYLDILTSSITTSQYRHQCIQHVLNVFAYYLTHFYAEKEMELFNESLFKLEEHQPIMSDDLSTTIHSLYNYVLSYCHYVIQLKTILYSLLNRSLYLSNGAILGTFVTILNNMMESLATKYTTLLNQLKKYSQVETNKLTVDQFSWEIYQCSLCYNYIMDHLILILKEISDRVTTMILNNKQRYVEAMDSTSLPINSTTPKEEENEVIKQQFFILLCQDSSCQESLKNLIHMTSVPSAILFPKLITLYKSLLSDSTHFIYKLYSLPIKTLLNIIPTLDMWMDTNAQSSLHTLPSEYIMPLGEYLLKFVEQVEVSYNLLSDSLSDTKNAFEDKKEAEVPIVVDATAHQLMMSSDWCELYESLAEKDVKKIESLFGFSLDSDQKVIHVEPDNSDDPVYTTFIDYHFSVLINVVLSNYYESIFMVQRAKFGGIRQLCVDSQYLLNVLNAFDCGTPLALEDLITSCQYNDAELSDLIGRIASSDSTQSNLILKKMGKFRGILGC